MGGADCSHGNERERCVEILPLGVSDILRMRELMRKYRDLPMDLADAALVLVAERERLRRIFTIARRHCCPN